MRRGVRTATGAAVLSRRYIVPPTGNARSSLVTPELVTQARKLRSEGKGPAEIGRLLGIGRKVVSRILDGPC